MRQETLDQIPQESPLVTAQLKEQLKGLFEKMEKPTCLVSVVDPKAPACLELGGFLRQVASASPLLEVEFVEKGEDPKLEEELNAYLLPVVGLYRDGQYLGAAFHGVPGGQEFNAFVLAICHGAGLGQPLDLKTEKRIKGLKKKNNIKVCVSLSCHYCPGVVEACQRIALLNPNVTAEMVDARLYPDLVEKFKISRVPAILMNDKALYLGGKDMDQVLGLLR